MSSRYKYLGRFALTALGIMLLVSVQGCGGPFSGAVSGKVTYKGNALPGGIVTVIHPDGRNKEARIQEDGTYSIPDAPGGECKVTVHTIPPKPGSSFIKIGGQPLAPEPFYPAGKYVPIPKKYGDANTSGLSLTVKRGNSEFDIEIKD
jgi:hypothetical protein